MSRLLHLPLFWKLTLAQLMLLCLVGIGVATVLRGARDTDAQAVLWLFGIAGVLAAGGISAWLTRIALSPLEAIAETTERIRGGDYRARVPPSPVADPRLDRVGSILNEMLDSLDHARRRQRQLSLQVLRSHERERGRMSGDLYDQTAQTLAGVLVHLKVVGRRESVDPGGLTLVTDQVRAALHEVRAVARRLRPPELNDLGVRSALEALARQVEEQHGVSVLLDGELPEARLGEDARLVLFRVVQEAVDNVVRHARTAEARVTLGTDSGEAWVEIRDDGVGFDPRTPGGDGVARLGLATMIERAGYASGRITVAAAPGAGTRVSLTLPLDDEPVPKDDDFGGALVGATGPRPPSIVSNPVSGGPHVR